MNSLAISVTDCEHIDWRLSLVSSFSEKFVAAHFGTFATLSAASGLGMITVPLFGALSDKIGRRPVYLFGAFLTAAFAFPLFWLINTAVPMLFFLSIVFGYAVALNLMITLGCGDNLTIWDSRVAANQIQD